MRIHSINKEINTKNNYIVGIGASAGGLEAIHDLFDYMPNNTGFSFIVIQHLSPDHKSLMAELLSKHTVMQVHEAEDGMVVMPNCIYVIPTKKIMTIQDGKLRLNEKLKSRLPNNAIDVFFESLAENSRKNAIGIILSGTGTDGSKGVESIKKCGGVVLVQDPLSASFNGMPNSAIETDCADLILPPEMMGEELLTYLKETPLLKSLSKLNSNDEIILKEIIDILRHSTRHDFTYYKRPTLLRRLAKRMSEVGINSIRDYKNFLVDREEEVKILSKEFLINVTKFFRDTEAFEILQTEVVPSLVESRKPDDTIKVWVVACSSGEEAYSLAMLFLEYFTSRNIVDTKFKIFATDIDSDALEIASRGVYSENIEKDVSPERLKKFFAREGKSYRALPDLRKHVVFANHDILKDPPFSHLDLITCRNMFIYINNILQQKILKKFHFALKLNSYLMLGPSENIDVLKESMEEVNRKWKLYRCINKAGLLDHENLIMPLDKDNLYRTSRPVANSRNVLNHLTEIFKDTLLESHLMAAIFIDKEFNIKQAIGAYKNFLHFPEDNFNFNLLKLSSGDLAVALGVSVRKAASQNEKVIMKRVVLHEKDGTRQINLVVKPYLKQTEFQQAFLCVILEEVQLEVKSQRVVTEQSIASLDRINELEQELIDTRGNLQAVIEEMETTNEELQSSNEEMISTNEELQSTNEELQSLNEELHTVSGEHQLKIKELLELNDDLNNYFSNSEIGQILVDKNLMIRKFSPAVTKMINLIEADLGRSITDITTNIKEFDFNEVIRNVSKTEIPVEKEIAVSNDRFYLMRVAPYLKRDKSVDGLVINFTNITESKKLSSIIEGIFICSNNGITAMKALRNSADKIIDFELLAINNAAEKFFGVKSSSVIGKSILTIFPDLDSQYIKLYATVTETDREANFEFYDKRTGKWYTVGVVKMLDGVVTTHVDITEKKKTADVIAKNYEELKHTTQQLERSNFDLLQYASVASHDLKEPLRKIQAFGNILQSKIKDKLTIDELNYFNKIISSSSRMQKLIEDILSLSKLSDNGVAKEKVDLSKVTKNIIDDLEITIKEKKAHVEIGKLPVINAVTWQMHQLFQNLISNALKFSQKEDCVPNVTVAQREISEEEARELNIIPENYVCISVKDNGIGFENEYKDKIFGIFQRLNGRDYEGTGIGLAIAKKIIENHKGTITATGELNEGAEFSIFLPLT